jgi:hypothetical protein
MDIEIEAYTQRLEQQIVGMNRQIVLQSLQIDKLSEELAKYAPDGSTNGQAKNGSPEAPSRNEGRSGDVGSILKGK